MQSLKKSKCIPVWKPLPKRYKMMCEREILVKCETKKYRSDKLKRNGLLRKFNASKTSLCGGDVVLLRGSFGIQVNFLLLLLIRMQFKLNSENNI